MKIGGSGSSRIPQPVTPSGKILLAHWREALMARNFHRQRVEVGKIEATLAAHKLAWLEALIAEIERL